MQGDGSLAHPRQAVGRIGLIQRGPCNDMLLVAVCGLSTTSLALCVVSVVATFRLWRRVRKDWRPSQIGFGLTIRSALGMFYCIACARTTVSCQAVVLCAYSQAPRLSAAVVKGGFF